MKSLVAHNRCSFGRARASNKPNIVCSAVIRAQTTPGVSISVENTSWNSRRIFASVTIPTPKSTVWSALTDYENLGKFIPSLVENRCLERSGNSCVLYQVGAQDVAMGVKFSAAVTLRCTEYEQGGLPAELLYGGACGGNGNGGEGSHDVLYPYPSSSLPTKAAPPMDIAFELLEGDFQCFRGVWRMQQQGEGRAETGSLTLLSYALYVRPQAWLPVGLIQGRIEKEVVRNLQAVSSYAEMQFRRQQGPN